MKKSRFSSEPDHVLVYSTEGAIQPQEIPPIVVKRSDIKPSIRVERKGRGGKTVTVLFKLPPHTELLKALATSLKKSLGSGGTSHITNGEGFVEIQGQHELDAVQNALSRFTWPTA